MFIDASAIVAILTREPGHEALVAALEAARGPQTSAIAVFEAALGVRRKRYCAVAEAEADVEAFLSAAGVAVAPIAMTDAHAALDAFARYGRGTGHPAQLNLGDCFAYAAAKAAGAPLLFVGDAFRLTDVERAVSA
jgi:ribonuclease VapC